MCLCRNELAAGQYTVMVLGYALESQYELTIDLVETQRQLRPAAALALGQVRHAPLKAFQIIEQLDIILKWVAICGPRGVL